MPQPIASSSSRRPWCLTLLLAFSLLGAAPLGYATPVVIVYPLTTSGDTAKGEAGADIAVLLATRLAQLGGLTVKPPTPGTQRADYLTAALKDGADYYVTGFIAPVGAEVSVIVQVVSTTSGTIVYSSSEMARTYGDAVGNADDISQAILGHAGRALASLDAPPPPPAASPTPGPKNAVGFNLTKFLGRTKRPKPAAGSTSAPRSVVARGPQPSATPAATGIHALVVATAGSASDDERLRASDALIAALAKAGVSTTLLSVSAQTVTAHAKELCAAHPGASTFYSGTLALAHDAKGQANVQYDVSAYDCAGTIVQEQHLSEPAPKRGGVDAAITTVATRAATALSRGPKS